VHRPVLIISGVFYKHLDSGTTVIVKNVCGDGSVIWESVSDHATIEGHSWGRMQGAQFVDQFRKIRDISEIVLDAIVRDGLNSGQKPN
jgi:hypothetical protein